MYLIFCGGGNPTFARLALEEVLESRPSWPTRLVALPVTEPIIAEEGI